MIDPRDSKEEFDLKLSGCGIAVERKIDRETFAAVMTAVMGVPSGLGTSGSSNADKRLDQSNSPLSLREFLDQVQATRKPDQIVAIGHFICNQEGQSDFSRDEVKGRFSTAREPMPANFPRDFSIAIKAGMLAEAHQKPGRFYLTKTGIKAVEHGFSKKS